MALLNILSNIVATLRSSGGIARFTRGWAGTENCGAASQTLVTVKTSGPVAYTELTLPNGVTIFTVEPQGDEEMPDPDFSGACGDGTWICTDGINPTTVSGGQASIGAAGSLELENEIQLVLDATKSYTVVIVADEAATGVANISIGGTSRGILLALGANIMSGWTAGEVGAGAFRVTLNFAAASSLILNSWNVFEESSAGKTFAINSSSGSNTDRHQYGGVWDTPIVAGDVIKYSYAGTGDYDDGINLTAVSQSYNVPNADLNSYVESGLPAWIEPSNQTDIVNNRITQTSGASRNSRLPLIEINTRFEVILNSQSTFQISALIRNAGDDDYVNVGILNQGATTRIRVQPRVAGVNGAFINVNANVDITTDKKLIITDDGTTVSAWLEGDEGQVAATSSGLPAANAGFGFRLNGGGGTFGINSIKLSRPTELKNQSLVITNCLSPIGVYLASIYDGVKDVDGTEGLATGVTAVRVMNVLGAGTITLRVNGVLLLPVFDTAIHGQTGVYHWAVSGTNISWVTTGVTSFQLGQGRL